MRRKRRRNFHRANAILLVSAVVLAAVGTRAAAYDRVPRPEFASGYELPGLTVPEARAAIWEYIDVGVLAAAIGIASFLALRIRSRRGLFFLTIFSIVYFGFVRKGCVCPVGSLQNVALAVFDPTYAIPITVVLFFLIPLVSTLLFGRTFCSSVCPLGAIQDLVSLNPRYVPRWLAAPLSFFPVVYLGLATLFAATGSEFLVCRFDPFISIYRFGGLSGSVALAACFLLLGVFVARPYCRFVCPYGVLLKWMSKLSVRHLTTTPDTCIQCRLCSKACPIDAIREPDAALSDRDVPRERKRLVQLLAFAPAIIAAGVVLGIGAGPQLAAMHEEVRLSRQLIAEDLGIVENATLASDTFRASTTKPEELYARASEKVDQFRLGSGIFGGALACIFVVTVVGTFLRRRGGEYAPDRGECVSCGKCFASCPREHLRRSKRESKT